MVLRVDKEKGYIDLSKRRVSPEDIAAAEEKFNKSKMVHSIMRHTAETTGSNVRLVGWHCNSYAYAREVGNASMFNFPTHMLQQVVFRCNALKRSASQACT